MDAQAALQDLLKLAERDPTRDDEAVRGYPGSLHRLGHILWTAATCCPGGAVVGDASPLGATDSSIWLSKPEWPE